jgi:site-specific DNA recombinase
MRAIGIVRQSKGDAASSSPEDQAERIAAHCAREGWTLVDTLSEVDVSGRRPLERRPGLSAAVEAVEANLADVVVVTYGDRLCRDVGVHREVVRRIEQADGTVLSLDRGVITYSTAAGRLMSTFNAGMDEYYAVLSGEKTTAARARAIAEGRPCGRAPFGYDRDPGSREPLRVEASKAPLVREAFRMREDGESLECIRRMLLRAGHDLSLTAVQVMLRQRMYLGEVRHGEFVNPSAHEPIVDAETFRRVQGAMKPRGPKAKSDRLLARLGVLRCGACDARMVVASAANGTVPVYRCPPNGGCARRQSITARIAEEAVVHATRVALRDLRGQAGHATRDAEAEYERTEIAYVNAAEASLGLDPAVVGPRLRELEGARNAARDRLDSLRRGSSFVLMPSVAWDELSLAAKRELVRAVVERAVVHPGRGSGRIELALREGYAPLQRTLDREAAAIRDDYQAVGCEAAL